MDRTTEPRHALRANVFQALTARGFLIGGTKGLFRDYPPRLYLDSVGKHEDWLPLDEYKAQWEDPLRDVLDKA